MTAARPSGHDWREWRRLHAWELFQLGWGVRRIALALAVSPAAVSRWLATARHDGPAALRARPRPGTTPKLTAAEKCLIPDFLWHGPEAYGFRGEVWTCPRIGQVLHEEFGVRYSRSQVARVLRALGWTPQVPIARAIQRDEAAIERWAGQDWPALKRRGRSDGRTLVFVDEAGFYLLPGKVRTYSPAGLRPFLPEWQTHDHLSVMG